MSRPCAAVGPFVGLRRGWCGGCAVRHRTAAGALAKMLRSTAWWDRPCIGWTNHAPQRCPQTVMPENVCGQCENMRHKATCHVQAYHQTWSCRIYAQSCANASEVVERHEPQGQTTLPHGTNRCSLLDACFEQLPKIRGKPVRCAIVSCSLEGHNICAIDSAHCQHTIALTSVSRHVRSMAHACLLVDGLSQ